MCVQMRGQAKEMETIGEGDWDRLGEWDNQRERARALSSQDKLSTALELIALDCFRVAGNKTNCPLLSSLQDWLICYLSAQFISHLLYYCVCVCVCVCACACVCVFVPERVISSNTFFPVLIYFKMKCIPVREKVNFQYHYSSLQCHMILQKSF